MKFNSIDFIPDPEQILPKLLFPGFMLYCCLMIIFFLVKHKFMVIMYHRNLESLIVCFVLFLIILLARALYRSWMPLLYLLFSRKPFLRVNNEYLWYGVGKNQVYITWDSIEDIHFRENRTRKDDGSLIPNAHRTTYSVNIILKKRTALAPQTTQRSWILPRIKRTLTLEDISHTSIHTIYYTLVTILKKQRRRSYNLQIAALKNLQ